MVKLFDKSNTKVTYNNDSCRTEISLYNTKIVSFDSVSIILNSGGYETAVTKNRMNQVSNEFNLNFSVFQKSGKWFVNFKSEVIPFISSSITLTR